MSLFGNKGQAIEAKFARDTELDFRARVRAFRFMSVWASTLKGETVAQARSFAQSMIHEDVMHVGDDDVVRVAKAYLGDRVDEAEIRAKMQEFILESKDLLKLEQSI